MENTLKLVYDDVCFNGATKHTSLVGSQKEIKWIPLLLCWNPDKYLGISEEGCWVVEERSGLRNLDTPHSLVRIKILLEQPLGKLRGELASHLNTSKTVIDAETIFPFVELIQGVLEDGFEYWMELAFNWYDELSLKEKAMLTSTLKKVAENKWTTQKLRHKARKELKQLTNQTM